MSKELRDLLHRIQVKRQRQDSVEKHINHELRYLRDERADFLYANETLKKKAQQSSNLFLG